MNVQDLSLIAKIIESMLNVEKYLEKAVKKDKSQKIKEHKEEHQRYQRQISDILNR